MGFTGRQITQFYTPPYGTDSGNLGKFEAVDHHGTVFPPRQCLYQKVAVVMQSLKM